MPSSRAILVMPMRFIACQVSEVIIMFSLRKVAVYTFLLIISWWRDLIEKKGETNGFRICEIESK